MEKKHSPASMWPLWKEHIKLMLNLMVLLYLEAPSLSMLRSLAMQESARHKEMDWKRQSSIN